MDKELFDNLCESCQAKCADAGEMPEGEDEEKLGPEDDSMFGVEPPSVGEPSTKPLKNMEDAEKRAALRITIGMMPKGKKGKPPAKGEEKE